MPGPLLMPTPAGLHCAAGGFHVDPDGEVPLAVLTHAHADHARRGPEEVVCTEAAAPLVRQRLGDDVRIRALAHGAPLDLGDVRVSLHPAGHVLGSAQVRVDDGREAWVITGDFKRDPDPTCAPFEVVPCDVLVTEATYGLPVFRWPDVDGVIEDLLAWWEACRDGGVPALLGVHALGKAQRVLAELRRRTDRPVHVHGAVERSCDAYRRAGVALLPTVPVAEAEPGQDWRGALVLAPPGQLRAPLSRRFTDARRALASGGMLLRGARRRQAVDRGFVLSDHADFDDLVATVRETGARRVLVHHGHAPELARWLAEVEGLDARPLRSEDR